MNKKISIQLNRRPSDIYTLLLALISRKKRFSSDIKIPEISIYSKNQNISGHHLESFNHICGVQPTQGIHQLYPFTLAYPYMMRILCRQEIPFSLFRMLNIRNSIIIHRPVMPYEKIDIFCRNSNVRVYDKGVEFDVRAEISISGEIVWELTATYYIRSRSGIATSTATKQKDEVADKPSAIIEWFLDDSFRFRFGKISGDTNGIHYSALYARLLGHNRDFAQPIRVAARCISEIEDYSADSPCHIQFHLKGPVYYNSMLKMIYFRDNKTNRFNLFCEGNSRPSISGSIHH